MSIISIRLNTDEELLLKKVADFEEIGLSSYIKKLDKLFQLIILKWIKKNLINCNIHNDILTILVLEVGYRNEI